MSHSFLSFQPIDSEGAFAARRSIPMFLDQEALTPNDAEAITFDGERFYYLITSHRRAKQTKGMLSTEVRDRSRWLGTL